MPSYSIAGSHSSSFNFLRNLYTLFHNDSINLHSTESTQGPLFSHVLPSTCYVPLILAILWGLKWYLSIVLNAVPLRLMILSDFACNCWPFVHFSFFFLFLKNNNLVPLTIFIFIFCYWVFQCSFSFWISIYLEKPTLQLFFPTMQVICEVC